MRERAIPEHFTPQQRAVIHRVRDTQEHLFLRATAGAGKTTTLVEVAWNLSLNGTYFAYNKHAVSDIQPRLPSHVRARTLHAHGLMLLHRHTRTPVEINDEKARQVAQLTLPRGGRPPIYTAARAWNIAREEHLITLDEDSAAYIASTAEWEGRAEDLISLIPRMHALGQDFWTKGQVDYTDLLWLPRQLGLGRATLPIALVDEAQDLTPLRQAFVLHLLGLPHSTQPGRLIFCGDSDQSIYTHAGADKAALTRLKGQVNATELPLSVSFRCPTAVVQYAQAYSTFIQSAPRARPGTIEHLSADEAVYQSGDVVLCRTNAPLIRLALQLMVQGRSVSVVGRDLERRLREGLQSILPTEGSYLNDSVTERVRAYYTPKAEPLKQRVQQGDRPARRILTELLDVCQCLRFLAWVVSREREEATLDQALKLLSELCREQVDAEVTLSSIHRSKGREWPRVTILYPELMPLQTGDPQEEIAVQFVGVTRAQESLRFAYGKDSWASGWRVKPGSGHQDPEADPEPSVMLPSAVIPAARSPQLPADHLAALPALAPQSKLARLDQPARPAQAPGQASQDRLTSVAAIPGPSISQRQRAGPVARPTAAPLDERVLPFLGGPDQLPHFTLRVRLKVLTEEPRVALAEWATLSLRLLEQTPLGKVDLYLQNLELFERAARVARVAVPNFDPPQPHHVRVCLFDGPIARIRVARIIRRSPRVLRVNLNGQDLRFDPRTGELLGAEGPLSTFILPSALAELHAAF